MLFDDRTRSEFHQKLQILPGRWQRCCLLNVWHQKNPMMELSEVSLEFIECANWKKKWKKVFESKGSWCKRWWTDWSKVKTIEFCNNNRNWLPDLFDFWLQCLLPNYKLRVDYYIWSAKLGSSFCFQIDYTLYCLFWCEKNNIPWEQCLGVKGCEILDIFIGSCFHPIWSHSPSIENIVKNIGLAYL